MLAAQHRPSVLPPHRCQLAPCHPVDLTQLRQPSIQRLSGLLLPELRLACRQLVCSDLLQCTTSASWALCNLIASAYLCYLQGLPGATASASTRHGSEVHRSDTHAKAVSLWKGEAAPFAGGRSHAAGGCCRPPLPAAASCLLPAARCCQPAVCLHLPAHLRSHATTIY